MASSPADSGPAIREAGPGDWGRVADLIWELNLHEQPISGDRRTDRGAASSHLAQLWSWLSTLWSEEGCGIDPSGRCGKAPAPTQQAAGCGIDPDGRCGAASAPAHPDAGCMLDPNGGCQH